MLQSGRSVSGPGLGGRRSVGRSVVQTMSPLMRRRWRTGRRLRQICSYYMITISIIHGHTQSSHSTTGNSGGKKKQNARLSGCFSLTVNLTGVSLSLTLQTHSAFYAKALDISLLTGLRVNRSGASFCLLHMTVWPCRCFSTSNFERTCLSCSHKMTGPNSVFVGERVVCWVTSDSRNLKHVILVHLHKYNGSDLKTQF